MVEKIKTDVSRLFLICIIEKSLILGKSSAHNFFIIKTKSSLSTFGLIFYRISKTQRKIFLCIYFGRKHVVTKTGCSNEVATFFKYHIPLITIILKLVFMQTIQSFNYG